MSMKKIFFMGLFLSLMAIAPLKGQTLVKRYGNRVVATDHLMMLCDKDASPFLVQIKVGNSFISCSLSDLRKGVVVPAGTGRITIKHGPKDRGGWMVCAVPQQQSF